MRYNFITNSQYDSKCAGDRPYVTKSEIIKSGKLIYQTEIPTPEQIKSVIDSCDKYNPKTLFNELLMIFEKKYNKKYFDIKFINTYTNTMDIFFEKIDNKMYIFLDGLVSTSLIESVSIIFLWSKYENDDNITSFCLKYLLFVMNDECCKHRLPNDDSLDLWKSKFYNEHHLLQLASDIYWVSLAFALSHELAHLFEDHIISSDNEIIYNQEFSADSIAYDVILELIESQKLNNNNVNWSVYYEYTYLAPLMLLDFYNLIYNTSSLLYDKSEHVISSIDPSINERKDKLLKQFDLPKYNINTEEGNDLYNCYLDICDNYIEYIKVLMYDGKLKNIIDGVD